MKTILYWVSMLAGMIASPITNGWALSIVWGWFVAPTFGLPRLSVPVAMGLVLTVSLASRPSNDDEKAIKDAEPVVALFYVLARAVVGPIVAVGVGCIIRQFV